jgi:hypothetical protein
VKTHKRPQAIAQKKISVPCQANREIAAIFFNVPSSIFYAAATRSSDLVGQKIS